MAFYTDIMGGLLLLVGAAFLLLGSLGLVRMPDIFNRIQAGTKTTTMGTIFTLMGAGFIQPDWTWKLVLIGVFLMFTNPISSQLLASTAHRAGAKKSALNKIDRLEKDLIKESIKEKEVKS